MEDVYPLQLLEADNLSQMLHVGQKHGLKPHKTQVQQLKVFEKINKI